MNNQEIVKCYYTKVYNTAYYYLKNRDEAMDITQDIFIKALKKINFNKVDEKIFSLLFIMTKNLSLNRLKSKSWKEEALPKDIDLTTTEFDPQEEFFKTVITEEVKAALNSLKKDDREIIVLKHYKEFTYKEVSKILNIPIGTVMSRLYNARKKLAEILKGENNEL